MPAKYRCGDSIYVHFRHPPHFRLPSSLIYSLKHERTNPLQMLWNWYTVDACFLSNSWHITSPGMFAGSCIGVIGLVVALEFLRRLGKEYDRRLVEASIGGPEAGTAGSSDRDMSSTKGLSGVRGMRRRVEFRPSLWQQTIRAALHMLQFAAAYFVMLLAMYYNGYIIICIFIGAFIGYFIFGWETASLG